MSIVKIFCLTVLTCIAGVACNKYDDFGGEVTVSGYVIKVDELSNGTSVPMAAVPVFVNTEGDSSAYVYETLTDANGRFTIPSVYKKYSLVVFSRFVKDDITYSGYKNITGELEGDARTVNVNLEVRPDYTNGLTIAFTDTLGGAMANVPFRLYTSKVLADIDSASYAYWATKADVTGFVSRYNMPAAKYYLVAADSIGPLKLHAMDSVVIQPKVISRLTVKMRR